MTHFHKIGVWVSRYSDDPTDVGPTTEGTGRPTVVALAAASLREVEFGIRDMGHQMDEESATDETLRVSRRQALKASVAAGVGVAVWAGPQIGRIGAPAAYAAHCTPGTFDITNDVANKKNTNWNDKCKPGMEYQQNLNYTFSNGVTFNNDAVCSINQDNGPATFTADNVPSGQICVPIITVFDTSAGGGTLTVVGTPTSGGTTTTGNMPMVTQQIFFDNQVGGTYASPDDIGGSMFFTAQLQCGPAACFHIP